MHTLNLTILGLLLAAGCSRSSDKQAPVADTSNSAPLSAESKQLDSRSQYDLAAAIKVVEKEHDDEERAFSLASLSEAWQGQRYEWTVNFLSAFCPHADGCHVVPFNRAGKDNKIVQGWSPQLELSDAQWKEVSMGCEASGGACELTFQGTLSEFRISTEELTRLTFSDVDLVAIGDHAAL